MSDPIYDVALAMAVGNQSIAFLARSSGIYRSEDCGETWQNVLPVPATAIEASPSFATNQTVIAGVAGGICRSTDRGTTWLNVSLGSPSPTISKIAISPSFAIDGIILLGTMEDGAFRSCDGGLTWTTCNTGLFASNVITIAFSADFTRDHSMLLSTESGVFRSTNSGISWQDIESLEIDGEVVGVAMCQIFGEKGLVLAASEDGGMYESQDSGHSWGEVAGVAGDLEVLDLMLIEASRDEYTVAAITAYSVLMLTIDETVVKASREVVLSSVQIVSTSIMKDAVGNVLVLFGLVNETTKYQPL